MAALMLGVSWCPEDSNSESDRDRVTPLGRFQGEQLASGGRWRLTFAPSSEGPYANESIVVWRDGQIYAEEILERGDWWQEDIAPSEIQREWTLDQQLRDSNGNPMLDRPKHYKLQIIP